MATAPKAWRRSALALSAAASLLAILGAEGLVRILRPPAASRVEYPCFYREDPRFGYRYVPGATDRIAAHFEIDNTVTLNALGFHDDEPLPPGASEYRVLAVGDSFTAALNVPREAVWTAALERELRTGGRATADVVNLGIDGTGTDVHRDVLREYLPRFSPDVVILAFYANDLLDVLHGRFRRECYEGYVLSFQTHPQREMLRQRVDAQRSRRIANWLFDRLYLARLVLYLVEGPTNLFRLEFVQPTPAELGIDAAVRKSRRPRLRAVFADLELIARNCDCRFVIAPVPPRASLHGSIDMLRNAIPKLDLELIDVVPSIERMLREEGRDRLDLFWVNDNHLNAYGNGLYARALAEALRQEPK